MGLGRTIRCSFTSQWAGFVCVVGGQADVWVIWLAVLGTAVRPRIRMGTKSKF